MRLPDSLNSIQPRQGRVKDPAGGIPRPAGKQRSIQQMVSRTLSSQSSCVADIIVQEPFMNLIGQAISCDGAAKFVELRNLFI